LSAAIRGILAQITATDWSTAAETIDELLGRRELGLHLINPWRVVVFGAPNVGKSSLINAIVGYERAIVSPMLGTTRDVVTVTTAIDGWPVILSDTAGFRETQDELESAGIKLATSMLSRAELAIFVYDAAKLLAVSVDGETKLELPKPASPVQAIHVINKIDLISVAERLRVLEHFTNSQQTIGQAHAVSALSGEGVADLMTAIARSLVPASLPAGFGCSIYSRTSCWSCRRQVSR
jgi:tRNA modification GTPase